MLIKKYIKKYEQNIYIFLIKKEMSQTKTKKKSKNIK